mgnify:CR=1 FL=1
MENIKERGLTPQEAADLIGCSAYTVKELARGNRLFTGWAHGICLPGLP